jgi:probable phosphoglycerate mutase
MMALELPPGLTLYFCRHGETQANVARRFQGDRTDTPLTPRGIAQCHAVAKLLENELGERPHVDYVSSPLLRARKTMELIRSDLGLVEDHYQTDDRLREINLGAWDGLTDDEARALDAAAFEARGNDKWNVRVPGGGENYADVASRAQSWIADLRHDTFAVSHGAFTRILRGLFSGLSWREMSSLDEPQGVVFRVSGRRVVQLEP